MRHNPVSDSSPCPFTHLCRLAISLLDSPLVVSPPFYRGQPLPSLPHRSVVIATFATRHRDSSPTPIALFLDLNHGEMVRFNWGLNYCHNTMYSPHLSVWYNDLTYETRCQVFSLIIIPLYIKGLHPLWPSVNSCALYAIQYG